MEDISIIFNNGSIIISIALNALIANVSLKLIDILFIKFIIII